MGRETPVDALQACESDATLEKRTLVGNQDKSPRYLRDSSQRWSFMIFASNLDFGGTFCTSSLQALETNIENDLSMNAFEYNMLFSIYSLPNTILPLFGGYFTDVVGVRLSGMTFQITSFVGQIIFTVGVFTERFWAMLAGRFVMGIGSECLSITGNTIIPHWFRKKEMSFAIGISLSATRLTASLASFLSPKLYTASESLSLPLIIGLVTCAIGMFAHIMTNWLDLRRERREGIKEKLHVNDEDKVSLSDIRHFNSSVWLLLGITFCIYASFMSFLNIAVSFTMDRFGFDQSAAGNLVMIIHLMSLAFTPVISYLLDHLGRRVLLMMGSYIFILIAYGINLMVPNVEEANYLTLLPIISFGIFYATFTSVVWPCYPLSIEHKYLGTAYGMGYAAQNAGVALSAMMVGYLKDNNPDDGQKGYKYVIILLAVLILMGACLTGILWRVDEKRGGILHKPPSHVELEEEESTPATQKPRDDEGEEMRAIVNSS